MKSELERELKKIKKAENKKRIEAEIYNGKKQTYKRRIKEFTEKTLYELEDLDIEKEEITASQWRLFIGSETVDIYPKGQKYCHINLKYWGKYEDLVELVESFKI